MSLEEIIKELGYSDVIIKDSEWREIAERYAQQRVNDILDKAADVALDAIEENESAIRSVSINAIAEALKNIKESILKLKNNEK